MVTMFMNGITISVAPVDVAFYKQAGYVIVKEKVEPVEVVEPVELPKKVSKK
jgi:hypothetical protein